MILNEETHDRIFAGGGTKTATKQWKEDKCSPSYEGWCLAR